MELPVLSRVYANVSEIHQCGPLITYSLLQCFPAFFNVSLKEKEEELLSASSSIVGKYRTLSQWSLLDPFCITENGSHGAPYGT